VRTYLVFQKTALLISHFWRLPLALKDSPLYKDAKYAITWKKVITRVPGSSTKPFICKCAEMKIPEYY